MKRLFTIGAVVPCGHIAGVSHVQASNKAAGEGNLQLATLVKNSDGLLRDGMTGYARIEAGKAPLCSLGFCKLC